MCEVNSCCCVSLRQGCIIIGGITILVSLVQTLIFSWVLVETYQSYQTSLNYQSSVEINSSMDDSSSSTYTFDSPRCPFGFLAISGRYSNDSYEEVYQDDAQEEEEEEEKTEEEVVESSGTPSSSSSSPETSSSPTRSSSRISAQQASPLALELELEEGHGGEGGGVVVASSTAASVPPETPRASPQGVDDDAVGKRVQSPSHSSSSSVVPLLALPSSSTSPSPSANGTSALLAASSSASIAAVADSFEPPSVSSSSAPASNRTRGPRVRCAAQGQGLLWALVVASALYTLVGILLIFAILYCVSWQLSIWFFYTVGYNLFTLIVALMDGSYTNPPDISSYVVCVIMTYCVSIVDSYYEKQLLHDERTDKSGPGRRRSSLVIVRSSPDTPTSIQQDYIPPTSYRVPAGQSLAPPPPAHSLAPPPPAHMLAPPPQKLAHQVKLAPPPLKAHAPPPVSQAPLEPRRGRENHHHHHYKYHNNL
ncbi:uncharacterized protein LOC135206130 [Macrobrachium nipponense]|uniref:uncharacterized protein LOC135206130 n=1 Tax=Macrobrachium nipponense TaxID=159736 RepID=UPI0030C87BB4